jgi:putative flippase GtrA
MRPGTPHFVLGTDNTIIYGRHFYCASTVASTCASIMHTFILNPVITNQEHIVTRRYLGRMMAFWVHHYVGGGTGYS